jgi:predicted dehydrogenase
MATARRVGIVGVGWGALVHAPAFDAVDGYTVRALCSRHVESARAAAERLEISDTSTDWRQFVHRDDLDLISISSPVALHHPMLAEALAAGKDVLCEKPLALNGEEGLQMAEAAESSGRATLVCFENRWSPERLAIRELVTQGVIGSPSFVQVTITSGSWHPSHRPMSPWMYRRNEGGGYLNGQLSHEIDFIQTLFGRVVAVAADVRHSIDTVTTPAGEIQVDADDTAGLPRSRRVDRRQPIPRWSTGGRCLQQSRRGRAHAPGRVIPPTGQPARVSRPPVVTRGAGDGLDARGLAPGVRWASDANAHHSRRRPGAAGHRCCS